MFVLAVNPRGQGCRGSGQASIGFHRSFDLHSNLVNVRMPGNTHGSTSSA
jgi:hypothetical protein